MNKDKPLTVEIKDDQLIISMGISTLAFASNWENGGPVENLKIGCLAEKTWAEAITEEITKDCGENPIPISEFLDKMIERAAENF